MTEWARHNLGESKISLLSIGIDHQATRVLRQSIQGARSFFPGSINATSSLVLCCAATRTAMTANSWGHTVTPSLLPLGLVAIMSYFTMWISFWGSSAPEALGILSMRPGCAIVCNPRKKIMQSYKWWLNGCQGNTYVILQSLNWMCLQKSSLTAKSFAEAFLFCPLNGWLCEREQNRTALSETYICIYIGFLKRGYPPNHPLYPSDTPICHRILQLGLRTSEWGGWSGSRRRCAPEQVTAMALNIFGHSWHQNEGPKGLSNSGEGTVYRTPCQTFSKPTLFTSMLATYALNPI